MNSRFQLLGFFLLLGVFALSGCSGLLLDVSGSGANLLPTLSISPTSGPVGTLVNVTGIELSSTSALAVNGTSAVVISPDATSVYGLVMPGSTSGDFIVTTSTGTHLSPSQFSVSAPSSPPSTQQGSKLLGTANVGASAQGRIALSADGNTLAVGGSTDDSNAGAVWIFTRSGTTWTQQGSKLVGTGAIGAARQGTSVSLSADGNTLASGGYEDNTSIGAIWIFTRSGTTWTQQGSKLVGTGSIGEARQGLSVSLSADGNTLASGGNEDNTSEGATWIFTRSGATWTQEGSKLVGTGDIGAARQGYSVSLSADGSTVAIGAFADNATAGAVWIFTRSGTTWTQQGSKLVGTGAIGAARQGLYVSLSADGNTLASGGSLDDTNAGAAWIFTRSGATWTQEGSKLVGTGAVGAARQGHSVSLSADGNTLVSGGINDDTSKGAVWNFIRSGTTWSQSGVKVVPSDATAGTTSFGMTLALSSDGKTCAVGGPADNTNQGGAWVFVP